MKINHNDYSSVELLELLREAVLEADREKAELYEKKRELNELKVKMSEVKGRIRYLEKDKASFRLAKVTRVKRLVRLLESGGNVRGVADEFGVREGVVREDINYLVRYSVAKGLE
jgi:hypothetical protein